jgi:hypothetical protein
MAVYFIHFVDHGNNVRDVEYVEQGSTFGAPPACRPRFPA